MMASRKTPGKTRRALFLADEGELTRSRLNLVGRKLPFPTPGDDNRKLPKHRLYLQER